MLGGNSGYPCWLVDSIVLYRTLSVRWVCQRPGHPAGNKMQGKVDKGQDPIKAPRGQAVGYCTYVHVHCSNRALFPVEGRAPDQEDLYG
jgi:hypothetical protein